MRVAIIGCGYVGTAVGAELVGRGHEVFGLRRTAADRPLLASAGIRPIQADIANSESLSRVPHNWDWVVNCVSSSRGTAQDYRKVYFKGTQNLLRWLSGRTPRKFVYTSSTSVYGQTDGSVVTETSPTKPQSDAAKILVGTEKLLLEAVRERGFPAVILRVSGIYGPERGYWLKQFVSGEARMDGSGERILNMVHRDDVVGSIVAALEDGEPGEVYNVSDDEPVSQQVLFEWLAQKLGKPMPPIAEEERRTPQKREVTNKKVSNARLKTDLGYQIKYPTFREGFGALLG